MSEESQYTVGDNTFIIDSLFSGEIPLRDAIKEYVTEKWQGILAGEKKECYNGFGNTVVAASVSKEVC